MQSSAFLCSQMFASDTVLEGLSQTEFGKYCSVSKDEHNLADNPIFISFLLTMLKA